MGALPPHVHLLFTLRQETTPANNDTTTIIVAVIAVLILICILFFVGRVLMFRRRTHHVPPRMERNTNPDNDYLMYAYLQTQSPSVVRMRRLANADGLSVQELNDAAPVKAFSKLPETSDDNICAVCLEEMEVDAKTRKMPCGHEFDARCIEEWVSKANRCPVCNTHVVEEEALQKRRMAALEGRDPSPTTTARQRRRRARGERGTYDLQDGAAFNQQHRLEQEQEEADAEHPAIAAPSTEVQQDSGAVQPATGLLPPRSEQSGGADQQEREVSAALPARPTAQV